MSHAEPKKPWSFLAYIAADNNLSDAGLEDIEELCKVGSSGNVHAAVQIDTYGEHDGAIRYEITPKDGDGVGHRTVIKRLPESDTGSPFVLKRFLEWGFERYPADRRLVVMWNHGSGFRSFRARRRDIAYDDYGSSLDMPEITAAFKSMGIGPSRKISVLGFDACLMNMLEIAHHFSDYVEVLVGSEQTEPGDGWPYNKVLGALNANPGVEELAKRIVDAYIDDYEKRGEENVTQSAIRLSQTEPAVGAMSELGKALVSAMPADRAKIREARLKVQSYEYADYVDLQHLAELLRAKVPSAAARAESVITALGGCILHARRVGADVKNSHGLSAWFPTSSQQYNDYRSKYLRLRCNRTYDGWIEFLDAYFA